jgi:hypothetical protein
MSLGESLIWLGLVILMLVGVIVVALTADPVEDLAEPAAAEEVGAAARGERASSA